MRGQARHRGFDAQLLQIPPKHQLEEKQLSVDRVVDLLEVDKAIYSGIVRRRPSSWSRSTTQRDRPCREPRSVLQVGCLDLPQ